MEFDFDKVVERRNTNSLKWDGMQARCGVSGDDAIALWVADMDFEAPPAVKQALAREVERSTHGYYYGDKSWRQAMSDWLSRRHGYAPDPDWITPTPGVVSGLGLILQAFSEPGDDIVVFSPVYHAFKTIIEANDRKIHNQQLVEEQGRYRMDFDGLKKQLPKNASIVFFCSPHNPGGRVWEVDEIRELAEFCKENNLLLVSDEIHNDLVFSGHTHHTTVDVVPEMADDIITCVAATKTFNLAGAHVGGVIISDEKKRAHFRRMCNRSGLLSYPLFGMIATEAAQRHGDAWLDALVPYLQQNRDLAEAEIARQIPGARPMHLEATYLGWINFSSLGFDQAELQKRVRQDARLAMNDGPQFGPGGENWLRFNFATPRVLVEQSIARLAKALS